METISYGYTAQTMLKDDPTTQGYIEEILDSANRASELTRRLLAFSRKQVIVPVLVDLNEIVRSIEKMLGRIIGEDIELRTVLSSRALPSMVDVGHMEQFLMNLATNARDAMPDGGQPLCGIAFFPEGGQVCGPNSIGQRSWHGQRYEGKYIRTFFHH